MPKDDKPALDAPVHETPAEPLPPSPAADTDEARGYRTVPLADGTTYYEMLGGGYGSFDEQSTRDMVAQVRLRANSFLG